MYKVSADKILFMLFIILKDNSLFNVRVQKFFLLLTIPNITCKRGRLAVSVTVNFCKHWHKLLILCIICISNINNRTV